MRCAPSPYFVLSPARQRGVLLVACSRRPTGTSHRSAVQRCAGLSASQSDKRVSHCNVGHRPRVKEQAERGRRAGGSRTNRAWSRRRRLLSGLTRVCVRHCSSVPQQCPRRSPVHTMLRLSSSSSMRRTVPARSLSTARAVAAAASSGSPAASAAAAASASGSLPPRKQFDPKLIYPTKAGSVRICNNTTRDAQQSNLSAEMAHIHRMQIGRLVDDCYKGMERPGVGTYTTNSQCKQRIENQW